MLEKNCGTQRTIRIPISGTGGGLAVSLASDLGWLVAASARLNENTKSSLLSGFFVAAENRLSLLR
jgi:hypothetical protein